MASPGTEAPTRESPFRGLGYYSETDAMWFFGRESERKTIIANLRAARLTLLYAESGVGKSSLLRAGVAVRLREIAQRNARRGPPKFIPVVFAAWKDEPIADLIDELERETNFFNPSGVAIRLPRDRLATAIKAAAEAIDATLLIILDQFEEYFGYRSARNGPERLASELAESIADPQVRSNFLIAIREDAYARIGDLFAGHKINVYGNYLHLEYLDRASAREAIEGPIERFNATHNLEDPVELESALTDAVLDEVRRGRLALGHGVQTANGGRASEPWSDEIETPFLQLVMTRLWAAEHGRGSRILRKTTLDELGGAETIVRTHVDAALATLVGEELEAATEIFHDLVTPSGAKVAHTATDLEKMTAQPSHTVSAVLAKLDATRIVRPVEPVRGTEEERYEIYHDRLTTPLLDWVALRDKERLRRQARAERRRANTFRTLAIVSGLLLVLAVLAVVFAELQKAAANRERRTSQSLQLAGSAKFALGTDPELSTLLALRALRVSDTPQAAQALRASLLQLRLLGTLPPGRGPLTSAAFDHSGTEIVTAGVHGTATIFSTGSHKQLGTLTAPDKRRLTDAAFSPNGRDIVTTSQDGTARIWSATRYKQIAMMTEPGAGSGHGRALSSVAFSPDGAQIVTTSSDGTARIWSATTHKALGTLCRDCVKGPSSAAFSPDGKEIVVGSRLGAQIFSTTSHQQILVFGRHIGFVSAAFSPDGRQIVTASPDDTARIWSATRGKQLRKIIEPGKSIGGLPQVSGGGLTSAAFSPDGQEIVTAGKDRTARVWSVTTGKQLFALAGHTGAVQDAEFSPNGRTIVTASSDGTAKLWNGAPLQQRAELPGSAANFTPAGNKLVTVTYGNTARVTTYETSTYKAPGVTRVIPAAGLGYAHVAVSPDGNEFVVVMPNGRAEIGGTSSHNRLSVLATPPASWQPRELTFSPDGTQVVGFGGVHGLVVWSATSHKLLGLLRARCCHLDGAAFSPDGKEVVGFDTSDSSVWVWSASSHKRLAMIPGPVTVNDAQFSPNGKTLVITGSDGRARILSVSGKHRQLGTITEPDASQLNSAEFSPDGSQIVTTSQDGTARIWSARSYDELTMMTAPGGTPTEAHFSPDGNQIVTTNGGIVRVWSTTLAGPVRAIERTAEMRVTSELTPAERKTYLVGN